MRKKVILIALSVIIVGAIGLFSLELSGYPISYKVQAKKVSSSALTQTPCGCHKDEDISKHFIIPSSSESNTLILLAKTQEIYKDYDQFLRSKKYSECTNAIFTGFLKNKNTLRKNTSHTYNFYYKTRLNAKKPFIVVIPYTNLLDANKIAGIVFVYENEHVVSYIIEVNGIKVSHLKPSVNILLENNNGMIINASQVKGADSIIDWQCARTYAASCAIDQNCWAIPYPINIPCFAACLGICYDMLLMP